MADEDKNLTELTEDELNEKINSIGEPDEDQEPETEEPEETEGTEEEPELELSDESAEESEKEQTDTEITETQTQRFKTLEEAEKAYVNLEKVYGRHSEEVGEARRRIAELEAKERTPEHKEPEITPQQLADLIVDDPETALAYIQSRTMQAMKTEMDQQKTLERQQDNLRKQNEAIVEFFKLDEFKNILEPEAIQLGEFLRDTFKLPAKGYFDIQDIKRAYTVMNHEKIVGKSVEDAKRKVLQTMTDSEPKVKTLSNAKNAKAKGKPDFTKARDAQEAQSWAETLSNEELDEQLNSI